MALSLSTFYNCCVAKDTSLLRKHFSLFIVGTFLMTIIQHFLFQTYSKHKKLILVEFVNMGCFFPHILLTYPMCHLSHVLTWLFSHVVNVDDTYITFRFDIDMKCRLLSNLYFKCGAQSTYWLLGSPGTFVSHLETLKSVFCGTPLLHRQFLSSLVDDRTSVDIFHSVDELFFCVYSGCGEQHRVADQRHVPPLRRGQRCGTTPGWQEAKI